ncbi:MAG: helix-turn-helix domain-containing protein [Bacteroidota bacterium]|nr:helix-turn-helix domain-containing protein [Bacteroidota bacterium]
MPQLRDPIAIKVLADNVKRFRMERNLSQEALANLVEIEYSQISRIERGVINTSVSVIFALAKALDVPPFMLIKQDAITVAG